MGKAGAQDRPGPPRPAKRGEGNSGGRRMPAKRTKSFRGYGCCRGWRTTRPRAEHRPAGGTRRRSRAGREGDRFRSATGPRVGLRTWAESSLIIGFDDKTLEPDVGHGPVDVRAAFHVDKIQTIVSRYSFDLFEVAVGFG